MSEWQDIKTAPIGQMIDVWVWWAGDDGEPLEGFRFAEVRLRDGGDPTLLETCFDGEQWHDYYPHENGQWVSHWMPLPPPPEPPDAT